MIAVRWSDASEHLSLKESKKGLFTFKLHVLSHYLNNSDKAV